MSLMRIVRWIVLALAVVGCVDSRIQNATVANRTVPAGTTQRLTYYSYLNPDCSVGGLADVRALSSPSHGTFIIAQGEGFSNYPSTNQRYDCNKQRTRMIEVNYTPKAGYRGPDELVVHAIYPGGTTVTNRFVIKVD